MAALVGFGWTQVISCGAQALAIGATRQVGSLTLHACAHGAYCGQIDRPLDPTGVVSGNLAIYFEFYPHTRAGPPRGALVATEGGPGYPATESRNDYLALFRPLRSDHDVLIMDNRGTGHSGAVDCHALQTAPTWTVSGVAECGQSLGKRAPLYSTAYAVDDLAAILHGLKIDKIDLYGDSYGTYFEQVFAIRHPAALRSIVLDGAYPLDAPDYAWYPTYAPAMRAKFDLACARSAPCASIAGDSIAHVLPALDALRRAPFEATAPDVNGAERPIRADASELAIVMFGSAPAVTTARETDAAARAFVQGDRAPLLRLMAETSAAVDSRDPTANPLQWSAGLAAAVLCQDPPQIFDMRLTPAERALDRDRVIAQRQRDFPDTYAPFSIDEYRGMPLDYSFLDECVAWPVSPPNHPASQVGIGARYPDIPALVISGELDNITTPADGATVAGAFKRGLQVVIANSFHVNALPRARSACAANIVRRFLLTSEPGDTSCASQVPALRLVPSFAIGIHDLDPAASLPGNTSTPEQLRVVTAALMTAGDVLARISSNTSGAGVGLRGGRFNISRRAGGSHVILDGVRWVNDLAVSGTLDAPHRTGWVTARLHVSGTQLASGTLRIRWSEGVQDPRARIEGKLGGLHVVAQAAGP